MTSPEIRLQSEYIYVSNIPATLNLKKYEGKKILVVGGGPTTNAVNWENIDYDFLFSCNDYYLCEKLVNRKVDTITLLNKAFRGNRASKFIDSTLQAKLDTDNTLIGIEPYHSQEIYGTDKYKNFIQKYKDRCVFFNTKFQNKSGAAPRVVLFATILKPKVIYMVGIDGHKGNNTVHSFNKDIEGPTDYPYVTINKHHLEFAKYLYALSTQLGIQIYNLGVGHKDNATSEFSIQNYPLTSEIKEALK